MCRGVHGSCCLWVIIAYAAKKYSKIKLLHPKTQIHYIWHYWWSC